jgi:hypothetical protein
MKEGNELGKISFKFDKKQLEEIARAGRLGELVEKAVALFRQDLKAELVSNVSSGSKIGMLIGHFK